MTDKVHPDEACHGIIESIQTMPNGERRRIQQVFVVRGDSIADYSTDLGPASKFVGVDDLKILSFGDDTVGQLMEAAEKSRHDDYWNRVSKELLEGSTLLKDFVDEKDQNWKVIRNQSTFGPAVTKQRNEFSRS